MLTTLRIKNLALVEDLTLELEPGFNAITGETGAGKSILIGALNLVLGERADRTLIREGSEACSVEAVFDARNLSVPLDDYLDENGLEPCEEQQLLLKRTVKSSGTNRQFINGTPATLNALSKLGDWLVDIHGPHDHQSLLQTGRQLAILDAYGGLEQERQDFAGLVQQRQALESEKAELVVDEQQYAQQLDLLRYQVREIEEAQLEAEEEGQLEEDYQRVSNAAKLAELSQSALGALSEGEEPIISRVGNLGKTLRELERLDRNAQSLVQLQEEAARVLNELQGELSDYQEKIELDPARLEELEQRWHLIQTLKRKYGQTIPDILAFGQQARKKLEQLEQRDVELNRINTELEKLDHRLWEVGKRLSEKRQEVIPKLCQAVTGHLNELGFRQSHFEIDIKNVEALPENRQQLGTSGLDRIEFLFAPNPGETPRPLRAIASSGEMARVMLALKTVLAAEDRVPLLVFDEVDANVGGETAAAVGKKIRQIGEQRQTLCITHLAPVAACSATHYTVTKETRDNRTVSEIRKLDHQARVEELARMLGGQSKAARRHAESLLG